MSLKRFSEGLKNEVHRMSAEGRTKAPERVIVDYVPAKDGFGPRYKLDGQEQSFLRCNSNSYLSLSHHIDVLEAADEASHRFGAGPGAVRFIESDVREA